jgi:phage tail sheath protein FI
MPEYLAPGVYVEEVSFRPKTIEGLSTSVAGFIGPTRYGPADGPPELLTSFADFERIYGGLDPLDYQGTEVESHLAHAVRGFFDNGGTKLYVTRVYLASDFAAQSPDPDTGKASLGLPAGASPATVLLRARFPGRGGEQRVVFAVRTSPNLLSATSLTGLREHDVVYIRDSGAGSPSLEGIYDVVRQGDDLALSDGGPAPLAFDALSAATQRVYRIALSVRVKRSGRFEDELLWPDLSPCPRHRNGLTATFTRTPTGRRDYLTVPFAVETALTSARDLLRDLLGSGFVDDVLLRALSTDQELRGTSPNAARPTPNEMEIAYTLDAFHGGSDGDDGLLPTAAAYDGDDGAQAKTGLKTFEDVDEISIVAAPGFSHDYTANPSRAQQIVQSLITHCEIRMRYRVAVLDAPDRQVLSEVQDFRGQFDSTHAALYYPWLRILDPLDPNGRREIDIPPSGVVAGIYARTDVLHGVFKAPANEVALGAIGLETVLNKAQQDVLNPLGINCFRFFEGRGYRLWGARTISSDPEWKYISVRRYFAYLEHSIDKGTQWAVFENNNESLWRKVRETVANFLNNEWRNGALLGTTPEEAFFVRCDRSTMTQQDLDLGRLICLIGVAVVKPAEYVIFRIGQFTADKPA